MKKIDLEFFENYHNNKLTLKEVSKFENELTANQTLSNDYYEFVSIKKAVEYHEHNRLKQKLKAKIQEQKAKTIENRTPSIRPIYHYRYIAASVAVLLIALIPLYQNFVYPYLITTQFGLHEQPETRMSIGSIKTINEKSNRTLYNDGLKELEQGNYEQAIKTFRLIKNNTTFEPLALYNIALIEARLSNKRQAKEALQELINLPYTHYLKPKAKALQNQLDKSSISLLF